MKNLLKSALAIAIAIASLTIFTSSSFAQTTQQSCTSDSSCPGKQVCHNFSGSLKCTAASGKACTTKSDCPSGNECRKNICLDPFTPATNPSATCSKNADCSNGAACEKQGTIFKCVDKIGSSCTSDAACGNNGRCSSQKCTASSSQSNTPSSNNSNTSGNNTSGNTTGNTGSNTSNQPATPTTRTTLTNPLTNITSIPQLLARIIDFFASIAALFSVIAIIVAGIQYMTSGGNDQKVSKAKSALTTGIIGLIVTISGYLIISLIIRAVTQG